MKKIFALRPDYFHNVYYQDRKMGKNKTKKPCDTNCIGFVLVIWDCLLLLSICVAYSWSIKFVRSTLNHINLCLKFQRKISKEFWALK